MEAWRPSHCWHRAAIHGSDGPNSLLLSSRSPAYGAWVRPWGSDQGYRVYGSVDAV